MKSPIILTISVITLNIGLVVAKQKATKLTPQANVNYHFEETIDKAVYIKDSLSFIERHKELEQIEAQLYTIDAQLIHRVAIEHKIDIQYYEAQLKNRKEEDSIRLLVQEKSKELEQMKKQLWLEEKEAQSNSRSPEDKRLEKEGQLFKERMQTPLLTVFASGVIFGIISIIRYDRRRKIKSNFKSKHKSSEDQ